MAEESGAKNYGLRLTLGGASSEPHTVIGYTGHFWTDALAPVGGPGEVKLEKAREADKDESVPLKLEPMSKAEADKRRAEIEDWRAVARAELRTIQPDTVNEAERKADEQRDVAPVKEDDPMATGYLKAAYESIVGNESNSPTLSTLIQYFPALSFAPNMNVAHLERDDEIRNVNEPLYVLPERYNPEWTLESRNYPTTLGFLLKLILGAPTTTAGNGIITDPDSGTIPSTAYRHVWTAPFNQTSANPLTAELIAAYKDQSAYYKLKGAGCRTLSITTPETGGGRLAAAGPAAYMTKVVDPALTPAYESLTITPFMRRNLTIPTWLSGTGTSTEDFSVTIENPMESYSSLGIASAFPDTVEFADTPITFSGSIPKRVLDQDDFDALVAATGFGAKAKWLSTTSIAATSYKYTLWIEFDNAQYMTGGPNALENVRRIGGTFDFKATYDGAGASATVTLVNATSSYI